jgi:glutamate formiminotransferase / formiminotetrahydrofolate cyclodeaminase
MNNFIIECIANYSEARRPQIVDEIVKAIASVEGVHILDRNSDLDHNRSVITFVGPPGQIDEAAFRSIAKAAELIDLDTHQGEHPRLGATDVVPFVPIEGVTMEDCIEIARNLARRVGEELNIPVYLYEQAATRPDRVNLENVRRGQYEALKKEIATNPDRAPDFGPISVGPAGATIIGARPPLVAYNVYLATDDVSIARKIGKAVRHSSGGLRYVKGLGLLVEGRAQVSMNLTNYRETPLARVVEMIRRESQRYGTNIHHSELVGLIPQEALIEAAVWYLQLDQFETDQILERRLLAAQQEESNPTDQPVFPQAGAGFLDELASANPTPGGGSAAAYTCAAAAALVAMVARLTIGKKKYAQVEEDMRAVLGAAENLRSELTQAVSQDALAFEAVMEAFRLPKDTDEQQTARQRAILKSTLGAAREPLEVARKAVRVMELAALVVASGNLNAITDAGTGAALAKAALTGAGYNVRINLNSIQDDEHKPEMQAELDSLDKRAGELDAEIRMTLRERGGLLEA